ncbi:helix-hairpin-helix domain-containing protein [Providencia rettgeri]|nr:helix-hairpin-helix domain-containing protein [Providencia rettgeri]EJD6643523.1 helix-hairpin-helix domain-containing protein [Providencia rettgeri]ELL9154323.1 helix-hairpin-helix domain-containing protein [Providencia rettgeri]ELR5049221.1 helix-hairpin-helix domain-containing protein [Providencia rettgeri]ELR5062027.1 helix-hairpin-helix domain-containing protein [Providencia rettgeri]
MLWNTVMKHGANTVLLLSLLGAFTSLSLAKKIEAEKTTTALVQKKASNENSQLISSEQSDKVNINSASVDELAQKLSGIGKQKAKAIVEYRQKYGAFNSIENILEVQGIGPAFLEKNKDKIVL